MPAEVVKDEDVDQVKPINRLYYIATQWQKALDELKAGDMGRERMMAVSESYRRAPNFGGYDIGAARHHLHKLVREALRAIDGGTPPNS